MTLIKHNIKIMFLVVILILVLSWNIFGRVPEIRAYNYIGVGVYNVQTLANIQSSNLNIVFNSSGTHIDKNGYLKIRLDFYPTPDSKTYNEHHIKRPIFPASGYPGEVDKDGSPIDIVEFNTWIASLPTEWVTNPILSHFVIVPPNITLASLESYVFSIFSADVTTTIDNIMSQSDSAHLISPYMRNKSVLFKQKVQLEDRLVVISSVNERLNAFTVGASGVGGSVEPVVSQSIDVGPGATNRATTLSTDDYTYIDMDNPANADGTIDTYQIWASTSMTGAKVGLFFFVDGSTYECRSATTVGDVASGSVQTFSGLSLNVVTGDYAAIFWDTGAIEFDSSGYLGVFRNTTDLMTAGLSGEFAAQDSDGAISIYATGTEAGGALDISTTPVTYDFGFIVENENYPTGLSYFGLVNNGSASVNVTIWSSNWTSASSTWTVSDDNTNGSYTIGLTAGLLGQSYNITVKNNAPYNVLIYYLAASANQTWGLNLKTPTIFTDGDQHSGNITLEALATS